MNVTQYNTHSLTLDRQYAYRFDTVLYNRLLDL